MKKIVVSILLTLVFTVGFTQQDSKWSVNIFALPVVAPLTNLNHQYVTKPDSRVTVLDKYVISSEFGFNVLYRYASKTKIGLGFSHRNFRYSTGTYFALNEIRSGDDITSVGIEHENSFNINTVGIRALINFELGEKGTTTMSVGLELNKPYRFSYSNPVLQDNTLGLNGFTYNEKFSTDIEKMKFYFIPEVNFSTQIYKNLALSYGMKLKFWGKENLYELDIYETGHEKFPSFSYEIDTRQLALFVGLTYTFQLPKSKR